MIPISITQIIRTKIPGLRLGVIEADGIGVRKTSEIADREYDQLARYIKEKFSKAPPSTDRIVSHVRRMYRRIGWEPTQYRPSSEAMIRRFLKNSGPYRINNIVDLGNIVSTRFHLPMGLYDAATVKGKVQVDVGKEEESYQGISRDHIGAAGKMILRDTEGIFGNPTADSRRTAISEQTRSALVVFFTPPEVSSEYLANTLTALSSLLEEECTGCSVRNHQLVF